MEGANAVPSAPPASPVMHPEPIPVEAVPIPPRRQRQWRGSYTNPLMTWEDRVQDQLLRLRDEDRDAAREVLLRGIPMHGLTAQRANRLLARGNAHRFSHAHPCALTPQTVCDAFEAMGGLAAWRTRKLRSQQRVKSMQRAVERQLSPYAFGDGPLSCPLCRTRGPYFVCKRTHGVRLEQCAICLEEGIEDDFCRFGLCDHAVCRACSERMH